MALGITGIFLPLNMIGTMNTRRIEPKTPLRTQVGMQLIKFLCTCLSMKTSSCSRARISR